jgi:hypothetical protein
MQKLIDTIKKLHQEFTPVGRYRFMMIDHRSHQIVLDERFFTKIKAINCLAFHTKLTSQFKYQLVDMRSGEEIHLPENTPHV